MTEAFNIIEEQREDVRKMSKFAFLTRIDGTPGKFASKDGVNEAYLANLRPVVTVSINNGTIPLYTIPYENLVEFEYTLGAEDQSGAGKCSITWFDQNVILMEHLTRYLLTTADNTKGGAGFPRVRIRFGWYNMNYRQDIDGATKDDGIFGSDYMDFSIWKIDYSYDRGGITMKWDMVAPSAATYTFTETWDGVDFNGFLKEAMKNWNSSMPVENGPIAMAIQSTITSIINQVNETNPSQSTDGLTQPTAPDYNSTVADYNDLNKIRNIKVNEVVIENVIFSSKKISELINGDNVFKVGGSNNFSLHNVITTIMAAVTEPRSDGGSSKIYTLFENDSVKIKGALDTSMALYKINNSLLEQNSEKANEYDKTFKGSIAILDYPSPKCSVTSASFNIKNTATLFRQNREVVFKDGRIIEKVRESTAASPNMSSKVTTVVTDGTVSIEDKSKFNPKETDKVPKVSAKIVEQQKDLEWEIGSNYTEANVTILGEPYMVGVKWMFNIIGLRINYLPPAYYMPNGNWSDVPWLKNNIALTRDLLLNHGDETIVSPWTGRYLIRGIRHRISPGNGYETTLTLSMAMSSFFNDINISPKSDLTTGNNTSVKK